MIRAGDPLHDAIRAVAAACDGAVQRDAHGFNMMDKDFGHSLAVSDPATWSQRERYAAWCMMRKYAGQLANLGRDFTSIPPPPAPAASPSQNGQAHDNKPIRRAVIRKDGRIGLFFRDPNYTTWLDVKQGIKRIRGAQFEADTKSWAVPQDPHIFLELRDYLLRFKFPVDGDVRDAMHDLAGKAEAVKKNEEASHAMDATIEVDGLGGDLRPFQKAGVAYAVLNERVIIGDEMGLGKTVQALATLQATSSFPAVVVCPASLKVNWFRESNKWIPKARVSIWTSKGGWPADIVILNYDILAKNLEALKELKPAAVVFDECHYLKTRKAKRTVAARDIVRDVKIRLGLSGTPVMNRPSELVTQLEILGRLKEFGGYWSFVRRYCGAYHGSFGIDASGAAHLDELNQRLRATCFIRRNKADVLKELPPKQRSIIPVEIDNRAEYRKAETDLIAWIRQETLRDESGGILPGETREELADAAAARARAAEQLVRIEALKKLSARGKMEAVAGWVDDFLESGEKIVIFAHHVEIVNQLGRRFDAPVITGQTSIDDRQSAIDRFQKDPACKVIALNIMAGGVGLTLTAASNVAFVELGWNSATHDQAEDRCHRIGQRDQVNAWYLIGEKTIDEDILDLIEKKRAIVTAATDGKRAEKANIMGDLLERLKAK